MKAIKIITHPYTVIISFFAILISGQHLGGFYFLYVLLALPHGGIHSLLAFFGIFLLLVSYYRFEVDKTFLLGSVINLISVFLLLLSLFLFFYNDKGHYNYPTFYQTVPQITLVLFIIIAVCFLTENIVSIFRSVSKKVAG